MTYAGEEFNILAECIATFAAEFEDSNLQENGLIESFQFQSA